MQAVITSGLFSGSQTTTFNCSQPAWHPVGDPIKGVHTYVDSIVKLQHFDSE